MSKMRGMDYACASGGSNMRALVIDDSRSMRMYVAALIEEQGWQTDTACDGQDALRVLDQRGVFDVATVDWDMPVMDGHAFVTAVRSDPRFQGMKLLMLTARDSTDEVVRALEAGADDYLMKPVTSEMLREKMRLIGLAS
jgi:two-component system chemotaxis response regulator CheY